MKTKNLILGGILTVVGLLMALMPGTCVKAVVVVVGLAAVASGIYNLFFLLKKTEVAELKKSMMIKGLASIGIGLIAVICPFALLKTGEVIWTVFSYILSGYLVLFSVYGFYTGSKIKNVIPEERKRITKESFISLLIAVLLIIVPIKEVGKALIRIVGIAGCAIGALLIIVEIAVAKRTSVADAADVEVVDDSETAGTEEEPAKETETAETVEPTEPTESAEKTSEEKPVDSAE